ncbi:MAG TPA: hypothetical protein VK456_09970 [Xanthobacteraceae bacterium]|nr:hypothetical protein [Xanthobacteraceae bacterium]
MAIATDVSPAMVRGLAAIAGAGRVYRFGAFYGRSHQCPAIAAATVEELVSRGLVRRSRAASDPAVEQADLTDAGLRRLLAGAPGFGAVGIC